MTVLGRQNLTADVSQLRVALMTSQLGQSSTIWQTFTFTMEGTLTTGAKPTRFYAPCAMTIDRVYITVGTAPTGAPGLVTVDVNKNGTTIFTTQANRPSIAATEHEAESGIPDVIALAKNDYLTFDIDAVGATVPGEYLTVHVRCQYGITGGALDLAEHAALATGVHGAGASTLATVANIATHAALTTTAHGLGASAFHADAFFDAAGVGHTEATDHVAAHAGLITGVHGLVFTAGKALTLTESLTLNALPIGGLAVATAANALGSLAVGLTTQVLVGGGAGTVPAWSTDLPTGLTIGGAYNYRAGGTDVAVADGGTGLSAGTSGGILGYTAAGTLASSAALTDSVLLVGGGAGATPTSLAAGLGADTQYLRGNAAGEASWATLNQAAVAGLTTADGPTFAALTLSSGAAHDILHINCNDGFSPILYFEQGGALKAAVLYRDTTDALAFYESAVDRMQIKSGVVCILNSLHIGDLSGTPADNDLQVVNDARVGGGLYVGSTGTDPAAGTLYVRQDNDLSYITGNLQLIKARAAGANVASGDYVGGIYFRGMNAGVTENAAAIRAEVDGTPCNAANDMPGRLLFSTSADGSATIVDRMGIYSTGAVRMLYSLRVGDLASDAADNCIVAVGTITGANLVATAQGSIGTASVLAQLAVDQNSATGAMAVLDLDQGDDSEEFINFIGSAAAGGPIIEYGAGALAAHGIRISINGAFHWLMVAD